jgi:DNA-binding NarL/FixJ family response regulator
MTPVSESAMATRRLSSREQQVCKLVLRGSSNKLIAYELGLSTGTVSTYLRRVSSKLQVSSRIALIHALRTPQALHKTVTLTLAEREVLGIVLEGASNAEIARRRSTSARTVAVQIKAIFTKLGVRSRAELAAALVGTHSHLATSEA